jgi:hypothetical protein
MSVLTPTTRPVDLSRLLLAVLPVLAVYGAAGVAVVRWMLRRLAARRAGAEPAAAPQRRSPRRRALRVLVRINFAVAALGVVCGAYSFYEPYRPEVTWTTIPTAKLPARTKPLRIVQISDIHSDEDERLEGDIPGIVAGLHPDVIAFTGDAVNAAEGLPHFRRLMQALAAIAPTFAVRGNWDVWWYSHLRLFEGTGVQVLDGRAAPVLVGAARVWLVGAPVDGHDLLWPALHSVPAGEPVIALHHYPEVGAEALRRGADVALAGDTHGGQVRLPLLGPLVRISRFGTYYDAGLHRIGGGLLYVNRGIGMEGGRAPRVRFLCRPEIAVLELAPASTEPLDSLASPFPPP